MTSVYANVLSSEEIHYLNNLPEVLTAKASLDARGVVYFSVTVTDSIRAALQSRFGLQLSTDSIPMRWIKGDTAPHIDRGASDFQNTYLMYLNDSPGELVVDSQSYPIEANTGFVFNEGISHETQGTEGVARLLLGPMNEFAEPVGGSGFYMQYYPTEADANTASNVNMFGFTFGRPLIVGAGGPYGPGAGYTSWRLASESFGTSSQSVVYNNGDTLNANGSYYLYPAVPCFLEGSMILCQVDGVEKDVAVEELKPGTLVKTSLNGYKAVVLTGKGTLHNPGNNERTEGRLYKCSPSKYPALKDDLYITGCHSILESTITDKQKEDTIKHLGKVFITDKKYRLIACVDERAEPWNSEGAYTIYHFALENADEAMNYGVYANGLLVETCSIKALKNRSNMTLSS